MDIHLYHYFYLDFDFGNNTAHCFSTEKISWFPRLDLDMAFYDVLAIPGSFH
jgi:hypothetical protein